jgi:16S rRNA (uracil1498-N3)-methyltransferase
MAGVFYCLRINPLKRFFVEQVRAIDGFCCITGSEARHISSVMRMGRGDRLILIDGKGERFLALIDSAGPQKVTVLLEKSLPKPHPSPVEIVLCQALLKSRPMDYIIQKTSELGVNQICPFFCERTIVRFDKKRLESKIKHWREIAHSATKQSDRDIPAGIDTVSLFENLTTKWKQKDALKVILWEEEGTKDLKTLLKASSPAKKFIGMVGPEGGFTRHEIEAARGAGFSSVSLGKRILRSETAAIIVVAIVQYELGDLGPVNISSS